MLELAAQPSMAFPRKCHTHKDTKKKKSTKTISKTPSLHQPTSLKTQHPNKRTVTSPHRCRKTRETKIRDWSNSSEKKKEKDETFGKVKTMKLAKYALRTFYGVLPQWCPSTVALRQRPLDDWRGWTSATLCQHQWEGGGGSDPSRSRV